MKISYFGHSCFSVKTGGTTLLFDPFVTYNDLAKAKNVTVDDLKADYILISHAHQDHVADAVAVAGRTGATVICAYELMGWFNAQGITNVHPMNTGGKKSFSFGTVRCVVAQHSSGLPDGSYGGNPMGFVISTPDGNFYYAGDTSLTLDMQLIPRWTMLDFAVFPIGDNFTMGPEDAAMAADMVQVQKVVGVHYDTFPYIVIDKTQAGKLFAEKQIALLLPGIGETIDV
jgi:L-ascorbate metabolism protein UlaG (beta-lactamase superfamily)